MKITTIETNPPRNGAWSYKEIRAFMLRPVYMDGVNKGKRLQKYTYVLHNQDGVIVSMYGKEEACPSLHMAFFEANDVTHWKPSALYLSIVDDEKEWAIVWTIPACTAAFLLEVFK